MNYKGLLSSLMPTGMGSLAPTMAPASTSRKPIPIQLDNFIVDK